MSVLENWISVNSVSLGMISSKVISSKMMSSSTSSFAIISAATMQSLGWALVHFLWQGTALAAVAAVGMALCRRASARYLIGVGALLLMLAMPVATFFLLEQSTGAARPASALSSPLPSSSVELRSSGGGAAARRSTTGELASVPTTSLSDDPFNNPSNNRSNDPVGKAFPWLVQAWLIGVAFFGLRTAGGFVLLERQHRRLSVPVSEKVLSMCFALQQRLGLRRVVRFCECQWLQAPAVIGWFRPIVLLPVATLAGLSAEQLESVIAHELAHIQRLDAFVNVFQVGVETLLFYHPAVWWLNQRIRMEREHCCDDTAIALCGNAIEYARALTLMEEWRNAPALAMAANRGPLTERIMRLMGLKARRGTAGRAGLMPSILCLCAALVAGNALVKMAFPKPTAYASERAGDAVAPAAPVSSSVSAAAPPRVAGARVASARASSVSPAVAPVAVPSATAPYSAVAPAAVVRDWARLAPAAMAAASPMAQAAAEEQSAASPAAQAAPSATASPSAAASASAPAEPAAPAESAAPAERIPAEAAQSYIDGLKAAGLTNLDADQLVALKIQGVTPNYVREIKALGMHPDVDGLIAMKIQGIAPEYVKEVRALGLNANVDQLLALKIQGVNAGYIKELKDAGIQADVDQLVALKIQGVSPSYVREVQAAGLKLDSDGLIAIKIQGVTPEYIRGLESQGLRPKTEDAVGMKIQGVTPEYVGEMRALGLNASVEELIGMKIQGVTAEYVKALQAAGYKLGVEDVIGAKVQGITPEFIERARKHGFQNLSLEKLMELKHLGVLETKGEI